jgi:hypothetical protein
MERRLAMTMKHFGMAVLLFSAMALTSTACMAGTSTSAQGSKMSGAEHKKQFPQGHDRSAGKNCYYDDEHDFFI